MFAKHAVYTILHHDALKKLAQSGRVRSLREKKRWVAGSELFEQAQENGHDMAILYADATRCSKLFYWGRLKAIDVKSDGTEYKVADLTPISRKKTQELVLRSSNRHIAKFFIRPYAIVKTPAFIC